jgi:hypothetical protein
MPLEYWWNVAEGGKMEVFGEEIHSIKQQIRNERLKLGPNSALS